MYRSFKYLDKIKRNKKRWGPTERIKNGPTQRLKAANNPNVPRPQTADPAGGSLNHKMARAMASSPYLPLSSSSGKRKQQDRKRKRTKKRGMADGLPGHLSAALKADNAWRSHGGERKRLNRWSELLLRCGGPRPARVPARPNCCSTRKYLSGRTAGESTVENPRKNTRLSYLPRAS